MLELWFYICMGKWMTFFFFFFFFFFFLLLVMISGAALRSNVCV
jgi:hypothetical protein